MAAAYANSEALAWFGTDNRGRACSGRSGFRLSLFCAIFCPGISLWHTVEVRYKVKALLADNGLDDIYRALSESNCENR